MSGAGEYMYRPGFPPQREWPRAYMVYGGSNTGLHVRCPTDGERSAVRCRAFVSPVTGSNVDDGTG